MLAVLIGHAFAPIYHQTPQDRIEVSHTILQGASLVASCHLPRGKLVMVNFPVSNGVLAIANHADFLVYIKLTNAYTRSVWYQLPSNSDGFYSFGKFSALVEIVATKSTELHYSCHYVGSLPGDCTEVLPASSLRFVFRRYTNSGHRSCFVPTDTGVQTAVNGDLGSGELSVRNPTSHEVYHTALNGLAISTFHTVSFANNGTAGSDLEIRFSGGSPKFNYNRVIDGSGPGVVGTGDPVPFDHLIDPPSYPPLDGALSDTVWILIAAACVAVFTGASQFLLCRLMRKLKPESVEPSPEELYDRPITRKREQKPAPEISDSSTEEEDIFLSESGDECPRSPYDRRALPL
jgi:hypothetical protein